jgi:hypothetical protein
MSSTQPQEQVTRSFDPELIEKTIEIESVSVDVYKIGGGTLGRSYIGFWGYRVRRGDQKIAAGGDLYTGMPKTHVEAATLAHVIFREHD